MPWTDIEEAPTEWPARNGDFRGPKGTELYKRYIDTLAHAETCGFDWVGCNEHHYRKAYAGYTGGAGFDEKLATRLSEIKARTLVLLGSAGKIIPQQTGQLLKQAVPQSHFTYVSDAAHALEFDQPRRAATLVLDFLDRGESFPVRPAAKSA